MPAISNLWPASPEDVHSLRELVLTSQGEKEATLLLKNCQLVDVHTCEIYRTDIGIQRNRIASITRGVIKEAREVIDCHGLYAVPGMIDPHMHVDTTHLWPGELARTIVPLGTTTVFVDTVNIAHIGGVAAVRALMDLFQDLPLRAYFSAPSYCPLDPQKETAASEITTADIAELIQDDRVVSIGETVSSKILHTEEDFLARLVLCSSNGKIISGHGGDLPIGDEASLDAYVGAGIDDDHCVNNVEDILPRLRRGLTLFLVEAPGRRQLKSLLTYIKQNQLPTQKICLCIDNITVMDIVAEGDGYLDKLVSIGLDAGFSPVEAIRMATVNPAIHYHKDHLIGSIAPGRFADILLLHSLKEFRPEIVITNGKVVAKNGIMIEKIRRPRTQHSFANSIQLSKAFSADDLEVHASPDVREVNTRVIRVVDGDAVNTCFIAKLNVLNGCVRPDIDRDIVKIAIVERYGRSGNLTSAFVQGFGLQNGAIATSYSIPSSNIVVVGTNEDDMTFAIRHLEKIEGGFVVVGDGQVMAEVPLALGGIMSIAPFEDVIKSIHKANTAAQALGSRLKHPFFTMSQTVLSTLPEIGLTDRGIIDVATGEFVSLLSGD